MNASHGGQSVKGSTARELFLLFPPINAEREAGKAASAVFQVIGMTRPQIEPILLALVARAQPTATLLCTSKSPTLRTQQSNGMDQLEFLSNLWSVTFNAAKIQVLGITTNPLLYSLITKFPPKLLHFHHQVLTGVLPTNILTLFFHQSMNWRFNTITLHHGAVSLLVINVLKRIERLLAKHSLPVVYREFYDLPALCGNIICDNCSIVRRCRSRQYWGGSRDILPKFP